MNQRQVQKRAVPADYPQIVSPVASHPKPAKRGSADDGEHQQLTLVRSGVPNATGKNVEAKSMVAKDPQRGQITVQVGPTIYAPTLSLSDVPNKAHAPEEAGRPHPCGACLPTPLWCL